MAYLGHMSVHVTIGENLHLILRRRGISGTAAASAIGIDPGSMSKKLRGARKFQMDELLALCAWLDVPVSDVFEGVKTR